MTEQTLEDLKVEYERWWLCFDRCRPDDVFGQMMIAGKLKKIRREYLKLKELDK